MTKLNKKTILIPGRTQKKDIDLEQKILGDNFNIISPFAKLPPLSFMFVIRSNINIGGDGN